MVNVGLFTKVRIWSGFYGGSLEKGKPGSGFSLVFFKFWSGFSLDLELLSPEYKVEALIKVN